MRWCGLPSGVLFSLLVPASGRGDNLVAPGIGTVGVWDTEFELSNPYPFQIFFQIGGDPVVQRGCPGPCNFQTFRLPPKASMKLRQADIFPTDHLYVLWVLPLDGGDTLPTVRARVFNTTVPAQSVEVPVTRGSTISRAEIGVLGFPSATRTNTAHSNLVLTSL